MRAVVIVANGWNAGWLGCYGNEWAMSPHADRLAAESVVFDQHFAADPSPAGWTHLRTGRQPFAPEHSPDLLAALRQYGVRAVRVHDLAGADDAGSWDESVAVPKAEDVSPGQALFKAAGEKLRELAKHDGWLLWVETDRLVPPWSVSLDFYDRYAGDLSPDEHGEVPPPWDEPPTGQVTLSDADVERLQATFAAVVTEWDEELGGFLRRFRKQGLDASAFLIVTSGQGIALAERDRIGGVGDRLHEEHVHVPLVVRFPNAAHAGRRVPLQTAGIDLLPTLLEVFGTTPHPDAAGRSLLPLAAGETTAPHAYLVQGGAGLALRTPAWACLLAADGAARLFRKPEDRWEVNDLRQHSIEWAEYLEATLRAVAESVRAGQFAPPALKDYHDVMAEEERDEHGPAGERGDDRPAGEGGLRRHQGDEED
jgi:arylsulfatase A-like enzyme